MQHPSVISSLIVIGIVTLFLFVSSFIPYTSTEIPQWRIQVVDSNDEPVANADVHQYALFWGRQEIWSDTQTTNEQGRATFPARTIRVSLARRAFARKVAHYVHLPYGPSAAAWVCYQGHYATTGPLGVAVKANETIHLTLESGPCPPNPPEIVSVPWAGVKRRDDLMANIRR